MTRRKASFLQGTVPAPYKLPAEDHRLNHAGLWAPSSVNGAAALAVQSGVVWGPGNPGAVTVVAGGVNIAPFHAAVQGSRSGVQGVFELTSDAVEFRAITAASSTQYRRGRLGVRIYDQLNGATKDDWDIEVLYGAAAASAAAAVLPAAPTDSTWFELRTFAVDNAGVISLSGTTPRTFPRGGILPVDPLDITPGAYGGQYRDHPTYGLQRWDGVANWVTVRGVSPVSAVDVVAGAFVGQFRDQPTYGLERWDGSRWATPSPLGQWVVDLDNTNYSYVLTTTNSVLPSTTYSVAVPAGRQLDLEFGAGQINAVAGANIYLSLQLNAGAGMGNIDGAIFSGTAQGGINFGGKLTGQWTNTTTAAVTVTFQLAGYYTGTAGSGIYAGASAGGRARLRHRLL